MAEDLLSADAAAAAGPDADGAIEPGADLEFDH